MITRQEVIDVFEKQLKQGDWWSHDETIGMIEERTRAINLIDAAIALKLERHASALSLLVLRDQVLKGINP